MKPYPPEGFDEKLVTFTVEVDGREYVIEHVPARVNVETGEQLFSPETARRVQQIVREGRASSRRVERPVFEFAA